MSSNPTAERAARHSAAQSSPSKKDSIACWDFSVDACISADVAEEAISAASRQARRQREPTATLSLPLASLGEHSPCPQFMAAPLVTSGDEPLSYRPPLNRGHYSPRSCYLSLLDLPLPLPHQAHRYRSTSHPAPFSEHQAYRLLKGM